MPVQFALPDLGENIESGDVIRILVDVGDLLAEDQTVIELETDKAVIEVPSSIDGTVTGILIQQGDTIAVGQPILEVETGEAPAVEETPPAPAPAEEPAPAPMPQDQKATPVIEEAPRAPIAASTDGPVPAAPSTRRLAREIGVDIAQVQGTGAGGRISIDDVKAHSKKLHATRGAAPAAAAPLPDFSQWGAVEREPMTKVREITAERLAQRDCHELLEDIVHIHQKAGCKNFPAIDLERAVPQDKPRQRYHAPVVLVESVKPNVGYVLWLIDSKRDFRQHPRDPGHTSARLLRAQPRVRAPVRRRCPAG